MPHVSVLVPVYNVEDYLDECLTSLVNQTFPDWEAVCVDDGSTDTSWDILNRHAARDNRIRPYKTTNCGVSHARNTALSHAEGNIVCFLDSDDRLVPDALERIVAAYNTCDADMVTFGATCFPTEAMSPWLERNLGPRDALYDHFDVKLAFNENAQPFIGRASLKRSFALEASCVFDETLTVGEDTAWFLHAYPRAHGVRLIPDRLYEYRIMREGSAVSSEEKGSPKRLAQHVDVVKSVFADWDAGGFLDQWPGALTNWAIAYCGYAILGAPSPERDSLAGDLGSVFERYLSENRLAAHVPRLDVLAMVGLFTYAASKGSLPAPSWKVAATRLAWRLREYGVRDLVETVLGHGGSKSGSGE